MNMTNVLAFLTLLISGVAQSTVRFDSYWNDNGIGRFQATVSLNVTQSSSNGWRIRLVFDNPVASLTLWIAKIVNQTADGKGYVLMNLNQDNLAVGEQFSFPIHGIYSGAKPTQATAIWDTSLITTLPQCNVSRSIVSSWQNGYNGLFIVTANQPVDGWTGQLVFSHPTSSIQIWSAVVVNRTSDGKVYSLSNLSWNGKISQGQKLEIGFNIYYATSDLTTYDPCLTLSFVSGCTCQRAAVITTTRLATAATTTKVTAQTTKLASAQSSITALKTSVTSTVFSRSTTKLPSTTQNRLSTTKTTFPTTKPLMTTATITTKPPTIMTTSRTPTSRLTTTKPTLASQTFSASKTTTLVFTTIKQQTSTSSNGNISTPLTKYDYDLALRLSLLFYEAQRSGKLPTDNLVGWRLDSALMDGSDAGLDLTGGWYDAGDHVKFGFPMASSATMLLYGMVFFKEGYLAAGQYNMALRQIKWPLDYFIKCHPRSNIFYGQVGDGNADHNYWGRPEDMTMARPSYWVGGGKTGGGADLVGETATALAAGSYVFKSADPAYSQILKDKAVSLYALGKTIPGTYQNVITNAREFYSSSSWQDEMAHAAAWLAFISEDPNTRSQYIAEAKGYLQPGTPYALDWDDKRAIVYFLLYNMTQDAQMRSSLETYMAQWYEGGSILRTPKGLAWRHTWGVLRMSANTAFLSLLAAKSGLSTSTNFQFARSQIHYMLGDTGFSYLIGFGSNYPVKPHHRAASCQLKSIKSTCDWNDYNLAAPNPQTLLGALVGGPDANDRYSDDRTNYITNEVACDYNAGFTGALAGLKYFAVKGMI